LLSVATDVTSEVSVKNLFDKVEHEYGHADVLVNNAGVSLGHTKVNDMELDPWWQNFVSAPFLDLSLPLAVSGY
jgi:NADP-dependent 3-hydroxy acid dehydrogenase YdfG